MANVPDEAAEAASKGAGELFTRLLTDACANEAKAALKAGGPMAIQVGFQTLGQLAMQELMTDRDVAASMGRLTNTWTARSSPRWVNSVQLALRGRRQSARHGCQRASFHHRPRRAPAGRSGRGARPAAGRCQPALDT